MGGTALSEESFAAVIVAAGSGTRFGRSKHDTEMAGRPLWTWSVAAFEAAGACEIVVVGDVPGGVPGGSRRLDSVYAGLKALTAGSPFVLVHDAARPLVSVRLIEAVVNALVRTDAHGVIPALPVTDTIKRIDGVEIVETIPRAELVTVQTPQGFRTEALLRAHAAGTAHDATDDATLVERDGGTVIVVDGDRENLKITFPGDLALAEAIRSGNLR